ncbi:MAG: class I SAM-dependent methyltransferase [Magnetococcales bacterium]|nr:class I SAM-dependent methyltransferase [Magnetococcales bacterium]
MNAALVVSSPDAGMRSEAQRLAERLSLPMLEWEQTEDRLVLALTGERLALLARQRGRGQPVAVDFSPEIAAARRQEGLRQTLARAAGLKSGGVRPVVLDMTPGLGRDAFVLAALGCEVLMVERSPVVAALLEDGLRRAAMLPEASRLRLMQGEAVAFLNHLPAGGHPCQVIYLDPMHPEREKSALVKKEMRLLRAVVGDDPDAEELAQAALRHGQARVVIKRPRLAPPLGAQPQRVVMGQSVRYDIYFSKNQDPTPP